MQLNIEINVPLMESMFMVIALMESLLLMNVILGSILITGGYNVWINVPDECSNGAGEFNGGINVPGNCIDGINDDSEYTIEINAMVLVNTIL